jgi:hypothetical protein
MQMSNRFACSQLRCQFSYPIHFGIEQQYGLVTCLGRSALQRSGANRLQPLHIPVTFDV